MKTPDKHIRKHIADKLNGVLAVYDFRAPDNHPDLFVLMSTQTKNAMKENKCSETWLASITLDIVNRVLLPGNSGSRLRCDEAEQMVYDAVIPFEVAGFRLVHFDSDVQDLTLETAGAIIYRKLIKFNLKLNYNGRN